jgi:outer membrane receptor protein involved in Fe transport
MFKQRNDLRDATTRGGWRGALVASTTLAVLTASPLARAGEEAGSPAAPANSPSAPTDVAQDTFGGLDEIIVTGAATHAGLKKLDTAYSVTVLSEEQIKEFNPTASADLLKASPGIWVESSGGQVGENVEVFGFPSSGALPFGQVELNGVSLFPQSGQSYLSAPTLVRPDETIERIELVQGGPSVLYGDGEAGLTINSILKRGTDTPAGEIDVTYGSEGSERVGGFLGGAIDKDARLYGTIGGYWRRSDGVHDPQYTAENDAQFTATLSKNWDDGSLLVYGRYENFKDQFVTDTPLLNPGTGKFSAYPGFSPLTGSVGSKADQYEFLQTTPCSTPGCTPGGIAINMANGRGPSLHVIGGEFNWDFGHGLQLLDDLSYTGGTDHMVAWYSPPQNPESLSAYIAGKETADKLPTSLAINAYYTNSGAAASLSQMVDPFELRYMQQSLHSVSNEVHLSEDLFPGNTLTVGNMTAFYGVNEIVYSGSDMLLQAVSNPTPIGINLTNGTNTWQLSSSQGFVNGATGASSTEGSGYNTAFFITDSWKLDNWLLDAGVRTERETFDYNFQNTAKGSLSGNPYQLFNSSAQYLVPGTTQVHYAKTASSWTVGLNYEMDPHMSAYVRANEGVHFPAMSDLSISQPNIALERAHNFQIGYKYQSGIIYADLSAFYRTFANVPDSGNFIIPGTTTTESAAFTYGSQAKGLEYQLTLKPFTSEPLNGFTLSMTGDYGYQRYNHSSGCVYAIGIFTGTVCNPSLAFNGDLLARQPIFQMRMTPAYALPTHWGFLKTWATVEYVGDHYGDMFEQQPLGSYYDLNFGISGDIGQHWEVSLFGTNMTNQIGLTEGNARINGAPAATGGVITARSIAGRELSLQFKYKL